MRDRSEALEEIVAVPDVETAYIVSLPPPPKILSYADTGAGEAGRLGYELRRCTDVGCPPDAILAPFTSVRSMAA